MTKKVLFIVASNGFQPIEYGVPRQILEDEKMKVITASDSKDKDSNSISTDGSKVKVDLLLDDVKVEDYDGVFIIGGPGAIQRLDNERTYRIIQEIDKSLNKVFGAICISTRILANADVLDGRKATGWNEDKRLNEILKEVGAEYIAEGVVVDRNLITADGPKHAQEFGQAILQALYVRDIEKPYESPY